MASIVVLQPQELSHHAPYTFMCTTELCFSVAVYMWYCVKLVSLPMVSEWWCGLSYPALFWLIIMYVYTLYIRTLYIHNIIIHIYTHVQYMCVDNMFIAMCSACGSLPCTISAQGQLLQSGHLTSVHVLYS